jgi:hypothetical protein
MSSGKLILAPRDPQSAAPSADSVLQALAEIGMTGATLDTGPASYLAGPRFLELISFVGCSAQVELEPQPAGGQAFCHIRLIGPFDLPLPFLGRNTAAPRCPRCGAPVAAWRTRIEKSHLSCERCGEALTPSELNWRRSGGFARIAVEVHNVFPSEAVPVPELMKHLAQATARDWSYFYVQNE